MKKILYSILLVISGFMLLIGFLAVSEQGIEFMDVILLTIFLILFLFSLFKLFKSNKNKNSNNYYEHNLNNSNEKHKQQKDILHNTFKSDNNPKPKTVENEDISSELFQSNNNLKKEVEEQKKYIKELEEKINKNDSTELNENSEDNEILSDNINSKDSPEKQFETVNYKQNLASLTYDNDEIIDFNSNKLDLTYTKARKLSSDFVVLDFETTGLKYSEHEIIQYGVVEFKNGAIINETTQFFKPDEPVRKSLVKKIGITNEFLEDKPKISEYYMEELHNLLKGKTIVAHNAPFDMKFLLKNLHDYDIDHERFRVFDTLPAARRLIHETPNHKLPTLKEYFNLDDGSSHDAINDARATGKLALLLLERMN
ncbi:3'-5' exonuclease [Staphylococcus haemolyticus]|uniref:3'-5' exonuclease n=8 Tax=Staphylococcus haemolyticus TaxID=1283 RepID=UPI00051A0D38|nr:3'-5' exonuclease [Staphylococcus haemolyticus]MBD3929478.1 3'-5' exonuclease [Staphylococcus haemolyticus]MBE7333594.1 3'-5' exonuclease [Staphylococcus haemolyticus]MBE7343237.1 3'-5' exonuclease [Staphylococcus haemolyticus]MBE7361654.1 3'-5' exonuclease [Staphylococcus haemolyticus]MBK3923757.1 3'-5' exonuclease [Staphylococcus haemolyticus]